MITRFKDYLARDIVCVDGELLSQPLWGSEQEKSVGIQRLFG